MTTNVISASYRTDIPAFYGAWFARRLAAGYALVRNPWSGRIYRADLRPEAVAGYVFWTRNPVPFMPVLAGLERPFAVQFTITGYGRRLEPSVPQPERAVEAAHALAALYGPRCVIWRYDPILCPVHDHVEAAGRLAEALRGATDECVVSFTSFYRKTKRNLAEAGFVWDDPKSAHRQRLIEALAEAVAPLRLSICAQPELTCGAARPARCIDPDRLGLGPHPERGNRPGCACAASRDIGAYDTCPHGCLYCYANASPHAAQQRFKVHDPEAEML
ncbi:MAG: DUF1848 domain-containing protein [Alphaproteobacteria bacterium]|nr:DUF1848 domain-containing protein [Alphaproteobacteria bacterium]